MDKHTLIGLLFLCTLLLVLQHVNSESECKFGAVFNFGDSNSDTGGSSAAFGQARWPHGMTYFGATNGRFCDGRLILDFITEAVGLPYISAYLDSMGTNFSHGANFATSASTIRLPETMFSQNGYSPISLDQQLTQFSDFHERSQHFIKQGGIFAQLLPKEKDFSSALYTFDIGQNDLTSGYRVNMTTDQVKAYVPDVLNEFSVIIKKIYDQGGRSFWIHNSGPVGCQPYVLERLLVTPAQINKFGCSTPFNEVAQYFNAKLKKSLAQLRKDLPLAAITYVDVYSLKYELLTQAKRHGFKRPLRACCGHGGKYNYNRFAKCGTKIIVKGKEEVVSNSCKDVSAGVNWDGVHYTEAANKWIFDKIVDGSYSDPPISLKRACHRVNDN